MGVGPFSIYLNTEDNFNENEQFFVDQQLRAFIEKYQYQVEFTARMPFTDLSLSEFYRIEEIKNYMIADLWERRFVEDEELAVELNDIVDNFGEQLFGTKQLYQAYTDSDDEFGQEVQEQIDAAFRSFINSYQTLSESDILYYGPKGDLLNMP